MKKLPLILLALLLMTSDVAAQSVKLPATATAKPGRMIRLIAQTADPSIAWLPCSDDFDLIPFPDGKTAIFCALDPGDYKVACVTAKGDKVSDFAFCIVTVAGQPTPPPVPVPPTPPGPEPIPPTLTNAWVIMVLDNKNRTPEQAKVVSSVSLQASLTLAGHKMRVYDATDPAIAKNNYAALVAAAGGPPALIILAMDGKKLQAVRLPATDDEVRSIVSKVTGK